jgi:Tfp pilus assembly protein FimT
MRHHFRNKLTSAACPPCLARRDGRGFTVIELLVSIGIILAIVSVVITSQNTYTDDASLLNLADEISLRIAQAQAYGTGVRELTPGSSNFAISYGLVFSLRDSVTEYISFADRNGNNRYDNSWSCPVGGTSECLEKVTISGANFLEDLCSLKINPSDNKCRVDRVDISFKRPNTDAQLLFLRRNGSTFNVGAGKIKGAKMIFKGPEGSTRSVIIYETGQISVE